MYLNLIWFLSLNSIFVYSQPVFQRVFGPDPFDNLNNFVFKTSIVSLLLLLWRSWSFCAVLFWVFFFKSVF